MSTQHVTFVEASALLGVSLASTYRWAREGHLGPLKRGYPTRIKLGAVEALTGPQSIQKIQQVQREQVALEVQRVLRGGKARLFDKRALRLMRHYTFSDLDDLASHYERSSATARLKELRDLIPRLKKIQQEAADHVR